MYRFFKDIAKHIGLPEELADYFALFIQDTNEFSHYRCKSLKLSVNFKISLNIVS